MAKLLFVLRKSAKKNTYSKGSFGLSNSSTFIVNKLNQTGHAAKIVLVDDANGIDREVHLFNPDIVVIEALWVMPAKFGELLRVHRKRKWLLRVHSKAPFLAMEGIAMEWLNGYHAMQQIYGNLFISCNNKQFNDEINAIKKFNSVYLPNIYCPLFDELIFHRHKSCKFDDGYIDIGCFGALRPLKNQFLQAIAAIMFADRIKKKLRFHINGTRPEQSGENVLRNIEGLFDETHHQLIKHEWYTHEDFVQKVVPEVDLGLQVSFSESFNIVTADFVHGGVPIIVSDDVDWMPSFTRVSPNSAEDIASKLHAVWITRTNATVAHNRKFLRKYNEQATEEWQDFIKRIT